MTDELGPNQQLLLWDLGLRGGRALQKDVDYKEIARDRSDLEHRKLLKLIKKPPPYKLELTDGGWNKLTKRTPVLLKSKRKPARERAILQLLLNTFQNYAVQQNVGVGAILMVPPATPQTRDSDILRRIRQAFFELAGNPPQDSVRLSVLRAKLHDIPRQDLDHALLAMKSAREANLMHLDNARDIKAEEHTALREGNQHFHVLWIER
jgi:hypothetical protein